MDTLAHCLGHLPRAPLAVCPEKGFFQELGTNTYGQEYAGQGVAKLGWVWLGAFDDPSSPAPAHRAVIHHRGWKVGPFPCEEGGQAVAIITLLALIMA
jgi:hypothetical protein